MNSVRYQQHCLADPIMPSVIMGSLFTGLAIAQGFPFTPRLIGLNIGALYIYSILPCPMEAIHRRQSSLHNAAAGGILGFIGVSRGILGVPFVNPYYVYRNPILSPPLLGAAVYGGMGFAFASLGGKRM